MIMIKVIFAMITREYDHRGKIQEIKEKKRK